MRNATSALVAIVNEKANGALLEEERLKTDNLNLLALIQPRVLSVEEQKVIGDAMRGKFPGKEILVQWFAFDQESARLGSQITAALRYGNVDALFFSNTSPGIQSLPVGIRVTGTDEPLVKSLRRILNTKGKLEVTDPEWQPQQTAGVVTTAQLPKPADAEIFVGVKPMKMVVQIGRTTT
jgi:hypothetical protein